MNTNLATKYDFTRSIYLFVLALLVILPGSCAAQQNSSNSPKVSEQQAAPTIQTSPDMQNAEATKCKSREEIEKPRPIIKWEGSELNSAILSRNVPAVKKLLNEKADPNEKDNQGDAPLINAIKGLEITAPLKPNASPNVRRTKLEKEAQAQVRIVEELLRHDADVNVRGYLGITPLIEAAFWIYNSENTVKILTLLIKHDADINAQDERGFTALINAVYAGKTETVKFLLAQGANAGLTDCEGETALSIAQSRKAADIIRLFQNAK